MFAQGRSDLQAGIDDDFEVLNYMLGAIPSLIEQSSKAIQQQINKNAEATANGDKDVQIDVSSKDYRNELLSLNDDVKRYFMYVMTTMIYTYAESRLKQLSSEAKKVIKRKQQSIVVKTYKDIQRNIGGIQSIGSVWPEFTKFNKTRNHIVHELFEERVRYSNNVVKNPAKTISKEILETNLQQVHVMLGKVVKRITEFKQQDKEGK